jgi:hypothetical protein
LVVGVDLVGFLVVLEVLAVLEGFLEVLEVLEVVLLAGWDLDFLVLILRVLECMKGLRR